MKPAYFAKKDRKRGSSNHSVDASDQNSVQAPKGSFERANQTYSKYLSRDDNFHHSLIFPGATRLLDPRRGERYLDVGCGDGSLAPFVTRVGGQIMGVDVSPSLIKRGEERRVPGSKFWVGDAAAIPKHFPAEEFSGAVAILSLQNMPDARTVILGLSEVIKADGRLVIVLNHPVFRIPRQSGWGWDDGRGLQYRRVDAYLTANEVRLEMNPGGRGKGPITYSFHQPISYYLNALSEGGFHLVQTEEWISDHISNSGPRARAENRAREEFPLFLALLAVKERNGESIN